MVNSQNILFRMEKVRKALVFQEKSFLAFPRQMLAGCTAGASPVLEETETIPP